MASPAFPPSSAFSFISQAAIARAIAAAGIFTTGNLFYVDPVNGNNLNDGKQAVATPGQQGTGPVQTLAAGYALLTSGNNDVLILIGNGAASGSARISSTFTWSKNAAHLVGVCSGSWVSQRARIAPPTTATAFANFFIVSGNGCVFSNVQWFQGFATGIAAEICMTVSGQRNVFVNCSIDGMGDTSASAGAASTTSRNLKITAGENLFRHCSIGIDTIARSVANYSVEFSGNCARNIFEDCIFPADATTATASYLYTAAAAAIDRYTLFKGCAFINALQSGGTSITGVATLAASSGGMLVFQDSWSVGSGNWGADATSKAQIYLAAPISTNAGGLATVAT